MRTNKYQLNIPTEDILNHKELCYVLGYIYADGNLSKNSNLASLTIAQEDMSEIKHLFNILCDKWHFHEEKRKNNKSHHKTLVRAHIANIDFHTFLKNYGFLEKSYISPFQMYMDMPVENRRFFIRGYLDGDGNIYISKKNRVALSFNATYDNDWSLIEHYFNYVGVKGYIYKYMSIKGGYSHFRTSCIKDILTICDDMYGEEFDGIGLRRKYEKLLKIKEYDNIPKITHTEARKDAISQKQRKIPLSEIPKIQELHKTMTIAAIAKLYGVSHTPIRTILGKQPARYMQSLK